MSQAIFSDIVPATTSGTDLATLLNGFKDAVASGMIGTSRPANLQAGGSWIDSTLEATPNFKWTYKVWTGTADITVFTMNLSTGAASISGSDSTFQVLKISADTDGSLLQLVKRRIASSGQVLDGDIIGEIEFVGRANDASNPVVAVIKAVASDNMTSSASGGYLVFEATNDGAAVASEMMRLVDGKLGVGIAAPETTLHVKGTGATVQKISDDAVGAKVITKKARLSGSGGVQSADVVSVVEAYSKDSASTEFIASKIEIAAGEAHTASARGTTLSLQITKTGAAALTEAIKIGDSIDLKLATTVEAYSLNKQDVATSATIAALSATKALVNLTGSTATDIQGIDATGVTKTIVIHNGSSATVTVKHEDASATAANRIKLPNSRDITVLADSSLELFYSSTDSRWKVKSGSGSGGGSVKVLTTATVASSGTIATNTIDTFQVGLVSGSGGAVTVSTTPFGSSGGWQDGTVVELIGDHDDNTISIPYNDAAKGAVGNFTTIELAKYQTAKFRYINSIDRWVYVQ